ncbi:hypothetical protein [Poseidonibacter lekithochrous]|uniref:hypothetical protein n=1 Tax=Poseidonibacter lekithochrous TaxID=1904463 RepID=UPI0008FCC0BB|nr:hypothetical protein [Poseidonibacter lekithochrous]QKJ22426.1 hypothetical protein ALEK_1147 [Poseidonibacter lekithochrous]
MNISEIEQKYASYQTQSNNSTVKTQSNEDFSSALENFKSYKAEESTKTDSKEEEYDEKYQLGLQRYNAFQGEDNKWLGNSVFEKDQDAKNEFINYLSDLSVEDYMLISDNLNTSFGGQLMEDENGNIVSGRYEKDPSKEFYSVGSTINYFENELNDLIEGARKFGGDPTYMANLLTDVVNFFKDYQSKEQENQYQALGIK